MIEKSRWRSFFGSNRRASCLVNTSVCVQEIRVAASSAIAAQIRSWSMTQRKVPQAGVPERPDAVLAPGPAVVPQLETFDLAATVGDERGQPTW
ncbi:hypothetical protein GCM10027289_08010 [Tsukamurella serpentis]